MNYPPIGWLSNLKMTNTTPYIYIGIDPGVNTGFAIYSAKEKRLLEVKTSTFWETITMFEHLKNKYVHPNNEYFKVIIEDVTQNKAVHTYHNNKTGNFRDRVAQNIGSNKRDCQLIIEWCKRNNIQIECRKPGKYSQTKLDAEQFQKITGYTGKTSQHGRDASLLVFGY